MGLFVIIVAIWAALVAGVGAEPIIIIPLVALAMAAAVGTMDPPGKTKMTIAIMLQAVVVYAGAFLMACVLYGLGLVLSAQAPLAAKVAGAA
jgi:hypothetical protein